MADEIYDITTDFSDQEVFPTALSILINADPEPIPGLTNVGVNTKGNANKVVVTTTSTLTGAQKTALDAVVAAYDEADGDGVADITPFAFTLVPDHVTDAVGDQMWEAPFDMEITRIAVTALSAVTTGDFPIDVFFGSNIVSIPDNMTLVGTVTLESGSLQQAENILSSPQAVSAGDHVVVAFGTITGTWTVAENLMVYVHYRRV